MTYAYTSMASPIWLHGPYWDVGDGTLWSLAFWGCPEVVSGRIHWRNGAYSLLWRVYKHA